MPGTLSAVTSRLTPTLKRRSRQRPSPSTHSEPSSRSSTPVLDIEARSESIANGALSSFSLLVAPVMSLSNIPIANTATSAVGAMTVAATTTPDGGNGETRSECDAEGLVTVTMPVPAPLRTSQSTGTILSGDSLVSQDVVTDLGDTTEDESAVEVACTHNEHLGAKVFDETYPVDVNTLYEYLFTDSLFFAELCKARKWTDLTPIRWPTEVDSSGCKTRTFSYTLPLNYAIGPKSSVMTEKQTCLPESRPGFLYMIDCECTNQGVPYADNFLVFNRYCITRVSQFKSRIRVHSEVKYKKSVWGFVKSFIDKNVAQGVTDSFTFLRKYMKEYFIANKPYVAPKEHSLIGNKQRVRRRLPSSERRQWSAKTSVPTSTPPCTPSRAMPIIKPINLAAPQYSSGDVHIRISMEAIVRVILAVLLIMFAVNAMLFYKLAMLESIALSGKQSPYLQTFRSAQKSSAMTPEERTRFLNEQQQLQLREIERWQQVLTVAVNAVSEIERCLQLLHKEITRHLALVASYNNVTLQSTSEAESDHTKS